MFHPKDVFTRKTRREILVDSFAHDADGAGGGRDCGGLQNNPAPSNIHSLNNELS